MNLTMTDIPDKQDWKRNPVLSFPKPSDFKGMW